MASCWMYTRVSADTGIDKNFIKYNIYEKVSLIILITVILFKYLSTKKSKKKLRRKFKVF